MSVQHAPRSTRKRSHALGTHLHGRWLLLARVGWVVPVVLSLAGAERMLELPLSVFVPTRPLLVSDWAICAPVVALAWNR
jgi:hypothetical protein